MPLGNPEAYMAEGMPPEEAAMAAGMAPDGMGVLAPMPDQDAMMMMLLDAVTQKWGMAEAQLTAEKDVLMQTLMQIAMPAPQVGPQDFAEGGMVA
jgi:hypothetical protein